VRPSAASPNGPASLSTSPSTVFSPSASSRFPPIAKAPFDCPMPGLLLRSRSRFVSRLLPSAMLLSLGFLVCSAASAKSSRLPGPSRTSQPHPDSTGALGARSVAHPGSRPARRLAVAPLGECLAIGFLGLVARPLEPLQLLAVLGAGRLDPPFDRRPLGLQRPDLLRLPLARLAQRRFGSIDLIALRRRLGLGRLLRGSRFRRRLAWPLLARAERLQMRGQIAARAPDHFARASKRLFHQFGIGNLLGHAACEQVGVRSPGFQRRLLARRGDIGIVEPDRGAEDLQLARHFAPFVRPTRNGLA